ncbi:MAG: cytochrome c biogenesis protein CcdA [Candidatus Methanoperedens sp.]|nr:cytochrome c biogenesis protein CcdA [Candidatus Methanoperedens sp.]
MKGTEFLTDKRYFKYVTIILIISILTFSGCLESSTPKNTLTISTEKEVYHSNETLNVHIEFNSTKEVEANILVSGINNLFGRAMLSETREAILKKGDNSFDFEFTTPSCEDCSAVAPGAHYINATISIGDQNYDSNTKITLERETNVSEEQAINTSAKVEQTEPVKTEKNGAVTVEYFFDPACQKCAKAAPVIDSVVTSYSDNVSFSKYNILTDGGLALARKYQLPGVPSVVINEQKIVSYGDYEGNTTLLEQILRDSIEKASVSTSIAPVQQKIILSVPSVFVVGFLAGFNPCLLAILAFIASVTLATTGRRRNVLLIVLMFSLGIFVTYLIVGIGLLNIIEQLPSLQASIKNFLVVLIGVLGLWHIYDAWHLRTNTESSFYTPKSFIRLTESVTKNVSLPASFFMGALFSLIKAPCVGAVYFVILDMVRSGNGEGYLYLAAYNFGVVLPVLVLGFAIAFGLNPEKVEKFRKEKRSVMRLITGVTLLAIAVLMYAGII